MNNLDSPFVVREFKYDCHIKEVVKKIFLQIFVFERLKKLSQISFCLFIIKAIYIMLYILLLYGCTSKK